jgi:hypothetical protein
MLFTNVAKCRTTEQYKSSTIYNRLLQAHSKVKYILQPTKCEYSFTIGFRKD